MRLSSAKIFFAILLFFVGNSFSDFVIHTVPEGKRVSGRSLEIDSLTYISMTDFALQAGYRWKWNIFSRKLTFFDDQVKLSFVQGNSFYSVDTLVYSLPRPPVRKGATLYLPVTSVIETFKNHFSGQLQWEPKSQTLSIFTLSNSIISARYEQKQNGTLISIVLADSIPFECTYFHPNLLVNFFGGKVDTKELHNRQKVGIVDSLFSMQYENSAQLSFMLNREIEKPHLDFNRSSRTLMISLKPKVEQKKPAAKEIQVDVPLINTVVIDPGHGGKDPGAIGPGGIKEKDIVLAVGIDLKKQLEKAGLKVFMTREKDVFIPLSERTKFANDKKADLFVSLHINAVPGSQKRKDQTKGYKIYFLSQAKNDDDKLVAMRENAVIELEDKPQNYSALQNVLIDIAGNEYLKQSQELCITMDQVFGTKLSKVRKLHLGVGQANFWVLNGAYMPSVLVELGFISNSAEEKILNDKKNQSQMASALYEAITKFKQQFETGL